MIDAGLLCRLVKLHHAVHLPVIGDGDGVHAELLHFVYQFAHTARAVQQAVLRMHMQVRETLPHAVASFR